MSAILPFLKIDSDLALEKHFMPHQVNWIQAEDTIHAQHKQVFALAEKSVRIGWSTCDGFKNVRKRLRFPNRDYLFVTKDWPSSLEYMQIVYKYAELFDLTCSIVSKGEELVQVPRADRSGRSTGFTEEIRVGVIKFDNGSRIIAFSSNPQAMSVYGGDVGLDEFARHPRAELLWETAQARITTGFDIAVWSAHSGEDTLFHQFAMQARAASTGSASASLAAPKSDVGGSSIPSNPASSIQKPASDLSSTHPLTDSLTHSSSPSSPWNLYYRVTMPDAIELGFLDIINRERKTRFTPEKFLADCRSRSVHEHIYQQTYLCNPVPGGAAIVDWAAIERCRYDYEIERVHLEHADIIEQFGAFRPDRQSDRDHEVKGFIRKRFLPLFQPSFSPALRSASDEGGSSSRSFRLGFDVAASGTGDLAVIYIDEVKDSVLWLRGLFSCRTEDWDFLETVLFTLLRELPSVQGAGDETGVGRQICWSAAKHFSNRFTPVNFSGRKHDLGFALANQLSSAEKRFPKSHQDIAADYFALRKSYTGKKWIFTEGRNSHNPVSHCDIAWAGALASEAHSRKRSNAWALVG